MHSKSILAVSLAMLSAGRVCAQTDASAEYARAGQLRSGQHPDEALMIYQSIYDRSRAPRALAQIGVTEGQMGRWAAAEEHLAAALASNDVWVRQQRAVLRAALERIRRNVGDLVVSANVSGARLLVDGTSAGTLPRTTPVRVAIGPVVIEVIAPHFEPHRRTVQVAADGVRVEVRLVPEASAALAPEVPAVAPAVAHPVAPAAGQSADDERAMLAERENQAALRLLQFGPPRPPVGYGTITVFGLPPDVPIFDGTRSLGSTPVIDRPLRPGQHLIRAVPCSNRPPCSSTFVVREGESDGVPIVCPFQIYWENRPNRDRCFQSQ